MPRKLIALAMFASLVLPPAVAGPVLAAPADPVRMVGIDAYGDAGLRVSGLAPGEKVTIRAAGASARVSSATKAGIAWFPRLAAGKRYAVALAGRTIGYGFPARSSLDVRPSAAGQLKVVGSTEGPAYLRLAGTASGRQAVATARQTAVDAAARLVELRSAKAGALAIAEGKSALEDATTALDAAIANAGTQPVTTALPATPAAVKRALAAKSLVRATSSATIDLEPGTSWVPATAPAGAATGSTVTVLDAVGEPWGASARLGADTGSVRLAWSHVRVPWVGEVVYRVTATPADGDGATVTVDVPASTASGARADVTLAGLDETEPGYLIAVQARNAVTFSGRLWRTLLSLAAVRAAGGGEISLLDVTDGAALPAPPPAPPASSTSTGSGGSSSVVPAPPPATSGRNRQPQPYTYTTEHQAYTFHQESQPYTYHQETMPYTYTVTTEHAAYTYHNVFVQTGSQYFESVPSDWSGTVCYGGTYYPGLGCGRYVTPGYNQPTKDATPNGWTDTGSDWTRQVSTKNATPTGWTDDGTQWTRQVKDATPTGWTDDGTQWTRQVKDTTPTGWTDSGTQWTRQVQAPCPTGYSDDGTQCVPV